MTDGSAIYVSLGHNSSCVVAHDGKVTRGYEQERLDRKKSSSAYPRDAIEECFRDEEYVDVAYVSHWFDRFDLRDSKYLDLTHLQWCASRIETLSPDFTHHDAHAASAVSFLRSNIAYDPGELDIVVIDGFGNLQECLSVYTSHDGERPRLMHRTYGYEMSLGLMYQYVTEYLGLRPNRDEYKLLGYESHVLKYVPESHVARAQSMLRKQAAEHVEKMLASRSRGPEARGDALIDMAALSKARETWRRLAVLWRYCIQPGANDTAIRCWVAWCAQTFLEECVSLLLTTLVPIDPRRTLVLTGGCAYNVKLNRRAQSQGRKVFSHPLAGDQGASLGHTQGLVAKGLTWGARTIGGRRGLPIGCRYVSRDGWIDAAVRGLEAGRIVNVVRGGMEYGPRALCNTTTLAWPTAENVATINALNERDEAMPMAPVVTRAGALSLFRRSELLEITPSDRFMITTVAWQRPPSPEMRGVAHPDPLDPNVWTARPQVVDAGDDMHTLLDKLDAVCLINTSFNYHGEPIVFTEDDACRTHEMQSFRAKTQKLPEPFTLLVVS